MNLNTSIHEESCLEILEGAAAGEHGIARVGLDTAAEQISVEYNPEMLSEEKVSEILQSVTPELQRRWESCTLRLEKRGGRACESCALRIEEKLQHIPGVQRATASYIGGSLTIKFNENIVNEARLAEKVVEIGIPIAPPADAAAESALPAEQTWLARSQRFIGENLESIFTGITLVAMLIALALEIQLGLAPAAILFYTVAYATGGAFGAQAGLASLREGVIDIDLLMILAALGAAIVGEPFEGAMLLFLFSLSNVLQDYAIGKTRSAIQSLIKLRPTQALVKKAGKTLLLPIEKVQVGDIFIVKPGERIPLDGVVIAGESAVDQASITGESMPVNKTIGDPALSGTILQEGSLEVRVSKLAKDSTIARLIKLVEEAQSEKAQTQRFIDTAERYYAMGVIAATVLAIFIPILALSEAFAPAFYRAMTLMVAASPCALVISTPATVLSAIGNGAKRGVLFKGGIYVEQAASIKAIAFDKTGTLTIGKPRVVAVHPLKGHSDTQVLFLAGSLESRSEHPLAKAIVDHAHQQKIDLVEPEKFNAHTGKGAMGLVNGKTYFIGNLKGLPKATENELAQAIPLTQKLQEAGRTAIVLAELPEDGEVHILGVLGLADVIKADAPLVVDQLKHLGIRTIMLTGDNTRVGQAIGAQVGVDEVHADLMPEDKVNILKQAQAKYGPIAMIGDGVNDAPALAAATIGIAMGAVGSDVALETADVVLMADDLKNLPYVIALSKKTRRTLIVNLGFALFMIVVMILAIFSVALPLPLAVIGHEGGTVLVSLNGLRMLFYRP